MKKEIKIKAAKKINIKASLLDAHRIIPKTEGGIYEDGNVDVIHPVKHMEVHGNLRIREEQLEVLKSLVDAREQLRKTVNGNNNRLLAVERETDRLDEDTKQFLIENNALVNKRLGKQDRIILKHLKGMQDNYPIIESSLSIMGIGAITVAYLLTYVDITKARYASSLWSYVGWHTASHERYTKGKSGGGNKTLRTVLYTTGTSIEKNRKSPYREIYENEKLKLSASKKVTKTRTTQRKLVEAMWKDTMASHRRGAAIRKMMKHFLADFWYVWRTMEGLETPNLYVEEKLGHKGIVRPEERGWVFKNNKVLEESFVQR